MYYVLYLLYTIYVNIIIKLIFNFNTRLLVFVIAHTNKPNEEKTMSNIFCNMLNIVWSCSKIYLFWIIIHYLSVHAYVYFCTPATLWGFISSPFYVMSPQCISIDWIYQHARNYTYHMWIILGTWLSSKIIGNMGSSLCTN